jgi:hypothetical protein
MKKGSDIFEDQMSWRRGAGSSVVAKFKVSDVGHRKISFSSRAVVQDSPAQNQTSRDNARDVT